MDPNTKRLVIAAGAIASALVLMVGVYSATGHRPAGGAGDRGRQPPAAGETGRSGRAGGGRQGHRAAVRRRRRRSRTMAPPPEAPAPQALKAQQARPAPPPGRRRPGPRSPRRVAAAGAAAARPAPPGRHSRRRHAGPHRGAPGLADQAAGRRRATPPPPPPRRPAAAPRCNWPRLPSEEAAMAEWQRLSKKMPDLLGGHHPSVVKTEHDGRTFFRLRTGGFAGLGPGPRLLRAGEGQGRRLLDRHFLNKPRRDRRRHLRRGTACSPVLLTNTIPRMPG